MAFNPDEYLQKVDPPKAAFNPDAYLAAVDDSPPAPEDEGLIGNIQSSAESGLMKLGEITKPIMEPYEKYVSGPIRAGIKSVADLSPIEMISPVNVAGKMVAGAYNQFGKEGAPSGKDIINALPVGGLIPETPLSEIIPGAFSETGTGALLKKGGALDVTPKGVAGGLLEAGLDPLSYVSGAGASKFLKSKIAGTAAKAADAVPGQAILGAEKAAAAVPERSLLGAGKEAAQIELSQMPDEIVRNADFAVPKDILSKEAKSLGDLNKKAAELEAAGLVEERPVYGAVKQSEKELADIGVKLEPLQEAMLKDESKEAVMRALKQLPQEGGAIESLKKIENAQRGQIVKNIKSISQKQAGRGFVEKEAIGKELMKNSDELYNATKKELGPIFEAYKDISLNPQSIAATMRQRIVSEIPDLASHVKLDKKNGFIKLRPYDMAMGLSKQEYSVINDALGALNKKGLKFKDIQRVREAMRLEMDPLNYGAYRNAEAIRKSMLGGLEDLVAESTGNGGVRETFQKYRVNEEKLSNIEEFLGGSIDPKAPANSRARSDRIVDTVFSSPEAIEQAAEYFGPPKVKQLSGDYVNQMIKTATDEKGNFSANKFATMWRQKRPLLAKVMDTKDVKKIDSSIVFMKGVTDLAPFNPSGTAPTRAIYEALTEPTKIPGKIIGAIPQYMENRQMQKMLESIQGGLINDKKGLSPLQKLGTGIAEKAGPIKGGLITGGLINREESRRKK